MSLKLRFNKKLLIFLIFSLFFGLSIIPAINGSVLSKNMIYISNNYEEKTIYNGEQPHFGSYPTSYEFVGFYKPPRELEWEYNINSFNGNLSKFNLLVTDHNNHSWNLSRFELHINGVNFSNPTSQSFYRKYSAYYQWEIIWDNFSKYCNGVILFEIIYLDCFWIHSDGDLDDDGDAEFYYSHYYPYSYLNGIRDAEYWFDSDKAYIVWYTPVGTPPDSPSKPSGNTSGYICIDHNYSTITTDPEGLNVSYGWDWNGDLIVDEWTEWYESNETCTIVHDWSDPGKYNVSVKAKNILGIEGNWSDQLSIKMLNHPPYAPDILYPPDGSTVEPFNITLCWDGGDPDICDIVTYDVYFGGTNPPTIKSSNQTENCYNPGVLEPYKHYYWYVVAWDNHGSFNISPIWTFTTTVNFPPSDPEIDGPSKGNPGNEYKFTFTSTDPENLTIKYILDWDDGNITETDYYTSGKGLIVRHTWNLKGTYIIKAKAEDYYGEASNESEFEIIIFRNKAYNLQFNLLNRLMAQLPMIRRLLSYL